MEHKLELVWARMKRYAPWPGIVIADPPHYMTKQPTQNKNSKCIFFFGTKNHAWVPKSNIEPYMCSSQHVPSKAGALKEAVERIEEYLRDPIMYKSNTEADPQTNTPRNTNALFDKLRAESVEESDEQSQSVVSASNVSSTLTPITLKNTRKSASKKKVPTNTAKAGTKRSANNGHASHNKRPRMSSSEDLSDNVNAGSSSVLVAPVAVPEASSSVEPTASRNVPLSTLSGRQRLDQLVSLPVVEPEPPLPIDLKKKSLSVSNRNIVPSKLRFGFLGLGKMGCGMVKNLIHSKHTVVVWNRTIEACEKFVELGAKSVITPGDVIDSVDITFSCVASPAAAKEMVFGNCGVLAAQHLGNNKGYVEMTGMDDATSMDISHAITNNGGRYLETQIQGSKAQSENGELVLMSAGDRTLYDECSTCFSAMSMYSVFLGDTGNACKMYMALQVIAGVSLAAMGEAMALAQKSGIDQRALLDLFANTQMASPMLLLKSQCMLNSDYSVRQKLSHMQKDLKYALSMSDKYEQPLPMTAAANEVYKHAKRSGYAEHDASAVYTKSLL